jgi:hypothetical protein
MITSLGFTGRNGASARVDPRTLLTPELRDRVRVDANAWIKRLRLVPYGEHTMRSRFSFRGDSLWWFTEIYLHKMRRLEDALTTIFVLDRATAAYDPASITISVSNRAEAAAARAFARARVVPVDAQLVTPARRGIGQALLAGASAAMARVRPAARIPEVNGRIAAFVHTAFWRGTKPDDPRESYVGDVLAAISREVPAGDLQIVGLGPRRSFRARRWWDPLVPARPALTSIEALAPGEALRESFELWRDRDQLATDITTGDAIRDAARIDDYNLWDVLGPELIDAVRIQWTWSARAMDEARAALRAIGPAVALTYAEAGGWGRALVLEARRLGIPTVGLQHGFIYRHWLNYQHEADEMRPEGDQPGFPYPTRTLVFDGLAASTLEALGHFPPGAIEVTGSARRDALASRFDTLRPERESVRSTLGVGKGDYLLVLAAKASEIGPWLPDLFAAVRERPGTHLVVKPHPAETRAPYVQAGASGRITVEPPESDLGRLLAACDLLVTMNSTVAIDALVLGVPALVIGLPNNLTPFVEAGVMAGADDGGIGKAIDGVLYDEAARAAFAARGRDFVAANQMRATGQAAARTAAAILDLAARHGS